MAHPQQRHVCRASTEPRSFERGNLQSLSRIARAARASTEPRSFERGNLIEIPLMNLSLVHASTEPRSFERGNPIERNPVLPVGEASTEPRSFERGNCRRARPCPQTLTSFNGAAFFRTRKPKAAYNALPEGEALQRSRVLSNAETPRIREADRRQLAASTEPRSFERGNRRANDPRKAITAGFNGAAFFRTRKLPVEALAQFVSDRFNGAAFFRTRKRWPLRPAVCAPAGFNGAAFFRTRKLESSRYGSGGRPCFNGAAFFRTRKRCAVQPRPIQPHRFNGAAFFRTRKPRQCGDVRAPERLQRSRVLSNAETYLYRSAAARLGSASTEPRSFERGNAAGKRRSSRVSASFNGAAFFRTRKPERKIFVEYRQTASTEPRSFERGNLRGPCCRAYP